VPLGHAILQCNDATIATELCEELWVGKSPHQEYGLAGIDIVSNASGSHHELRKLRRKLSMITEATAKHGGVYMYANLKGCDGQRMLFDGASAISMNGEIYGCLP
jgi:NAD+ synthase (glutamine-hydrolysing)